MLSKNPVFPVLWKFYNLIPLAFKVKFPGGSQIANIHQIIEKSKRIPEKKKTSTYCSLPMLKTLTVSNLCVVNHNKLWKILATENRCEYQTTLPAFWETCTQVKKQQLEVDMEQWTV